MAKKKKKRAADDDTTVSDQAAAETPPAEEPTPAEGGKPASVAGYFQQLFKDNPTLLNLRQSSMVTLARSRHAGLMTVLL